MLKMVETKVDGRNNSVTTATTFIAALSLCAAWLMLTVALLSSWATKFDCEVSLVAQTFSQATDRACMPCSNEIWKSRSGCAPRLCLLPTFWPWN